MESILLTIAKMLGIEEDYEHFNTDLVIHINSVLMELNQLGVGPPEGFVIEDETSTWTDFIPDSTPMRLDAVKSYMYLKVKLLFDPPENGSTIAAIERQIDRYEWRINVAAESSGSSGEEE